MKRGTPVIKVLCLLNALVFSLQAAIGPVADALLIRDFGLSPAGLEEGALWQLITHAFLHGNIWHLLVNLLTLWFAGRPVEHVVGGARFLAVYGLSAVGGGLLQILVVPSTTELIGASGAVFGILCAFCTLFADRDVLVLLFFVIPLRLRARTLGQILAIVTLVLLVTGIEPWIGHAAHLGGAIIGYLAARMMGYGHPTWPERFFRRQ
ncbi:MAG: rhomboid family intramembrane serine protease [Terrimicrobiaceae bacterium]|nr:rhomboid family intramembrane serine protease [Terrimicrobiaceae bacterium]